MNELRRKVRRFSMALNRIDGLYERLSSKFGYKANMLWLLYSLDDGEAKSQKQICEEWWFRPTTLNTIVKECEAEGYVTLEHIPGTRREMSVKLTESGKAYAHAILNPLYSAEEQALANTPDADRLIELLEAVQAQLSEKFQAVFAQLDNEKEKKTDATD